MKGLLRPVRVSPRCLCVLLLLCFCLPCRSLHAQGALELDLAPLDIFYSQSDLLPYIDQSRLFPFPHRALAAHSSDAPGANAFPLDLPDSLPSRYSTSSVISTNPQDTASRDNTRFRWGPAIGESLVKFFGDLRSSLSGKNRYQSNRYYNETSGNATYRDAGRCSAHD